MFGDSYYYICIKLCLENGNAIRLYVYTRVDRLCYQDHTDYVKFQDALELE